MNEFGERGNERSIKVWVVRLGRWLGLGSWGSSFGSDGLRWVAVFNGAIEKKQRNQKNEEPGGTLAGL